MLCFAKEKNHRFLVGKKGIETKKKKLKFSKCCDRKVIELSDRLITSISVSDERAIDHFFGMINERAIDLFLVIKGQVWRKATALLKSEF